MPTIIDGYNLLHVVGTPTRGKGPGYLERARQSLLNFLAESLDPADVPKTTIVFDAHDPPPGLRRQSQFKGITVLFAEEDDEADDAIELLISQDFSPKKLTVVSSDHRIQRAAKRRKARAVDSDVWYYEVIEGRKSRQKMGEAGPERPNVPLLGEQVEYWLKEFGLDEGKEK
jgi:predicted RNA-binding protein with PIN domain